MDDAADLAAWSTQRDQAAFERLLERHAGLVAAACRRELGDGTAADEAAQATFIVLAQRSLAITDADRLGSWLFEVAIRCCRASRRAEQRRIRRERAAAASSATRGSPEEEPEEPAWAEARAHLNTALAALTAAQRAVLIDHYLTGVSQTAIAARLGISADAAHQRIHHALGKLRTWFARHGMAIGVTTLAIGLASELSAIDPAMTATWVEAALHPTLAGGAAKVAGGAMAAGTGKAIAAAITLLLLIAATGTATALVLARHPMAPPTRAESGDQPAPRAAPGIIVTPRSHDAWQAFDELGRLGLKVVVLGEHPWWLAQRHRELPGQGERGTPMALPPAKRVPLRVPVALRFTPIDGRRLIEAVATANGLETVWVRAGRCAVLCAGADDHEVAVVADDLRSADATGRRDAAWRCGWLRDRRAVPLLITAAADSDGDVARQARLSLRRLGWEAVLALDDAVMPLAAADLASPSPTVRRDANWSLSIVSAEPTLALLEQGLTDLDYSVRKSAAYALGALGSDGALSVLARQIAPGTTADASARRVAVEALSRSAAERAIPLLEQATADPDHWVRADAVDSLALIRREAATDPAEEAMAARDREVGDGYDRILAELGGSLASTRDQAREQVIEDLGDLGGEGALTLLATAAKDIDPNVRHAVIIALRRVGAVRTRPAMAPEILALLATALTDVEPLVKRNAVDELAEIGGDRAEALLETAVANQNLATRYDAIVGLGKIGSPAAFLVLRRIALDPEQNQRIAAVTAFGHVGGAEAEALIEGMTRDPEQSVRSTALSALGDVGGDRAAKRLGEALAEPNVFMRVNALRALARMGGTQARDLLLGRLPVEENNLILPEIRSTLSRRFPHDPVVEKALRPAGDDGASGF